MENILTLMIIPIALVLIGVRCMRCGHRQMRDRCDKEHTT